MKKYVAAAALLTVVLALLQFSPSITVCGYMEKQVDPSGKEYESATDGVCTDFNIGWPIRVATIDKDLVEEGSTTDLQFEQPAKFIAGLILSTTLLISPTAIVLAVKKRR